MVACAHEYLRVSASQGSEEPVDQRHRLGGGGRLVVKVAGNEHGVYLAFLHHAEKLFKGVALVVEHGELVDALADVEVGEVHEAHGHTFLPENGMAPAAGGLDCGRTS